MCMYEIPGPNLQTFLGIFLEFFKDFSSKFFMKSQLS